MILGFLLGSALLMLGDRVKELNEILLQINEWMMSARTTINVVTAAFMVAEMSGVAVTTSFLLVLILVSLASPGTTGAWANTAPVIPKRII